MYICHKTLLILEAFNLMEEQQMSCKFIDLGEGHSAIVCGHKDHVCDEKMTVYTDDQGVEYWNHPNPQQLQEEHNIISGSVACSICHRPAIMDAYYE